MMKMKKSIQPNRNRYRFIYAIGIAGYYTDDGIAMLTACRKDDVLTEPEEKKLVIYGIEMNWIISSCLKKITQKSFHISYGCVSVCSHM